MIVPIFLKNYGISNISEIHITFENITKLDNTKVIDDIFQSNPSK